MLSALIASVKLHPLYQKHVKVGRTGLQRLFIQQKEKDCKWKYVHGHQSSIRSLFFTSP